MTQATRPSPDLAQADRHSSQLHAGPSHSQTAF